MGKTYVILYYKVPFFIRTNFIRTPRLKFGREKNKEQAQPEILKCPLVLNVELFLFDIHDSEVMKKNNLKAVLGRCIDFGHL